MAEDRKRFEHMSGLAADSLGANEYWCVWQPGSTRIWASKDISEAVANAVTATVEKDWDAMKEHGWRLCKCAVLPGDAAPPP